MRTRRKNEWFDNEAFWQDLYPFMFPEKCFAETFPKVEKVLSLAKPVGKVVLDLCCGPGRYSIALAKAGFHVTGVDKTKYLLDKARAMARSAEVDIEWLQMDMRDFIRADTFDIAINMWTSFGYFNDKQEDCRY
jgi:2-polyprenyl-3-methyl-5-hydroxy-6-metoxy-1,4-benzoquinol methylase